MAVAQGLDGLPARSGPAGRRRPGHRHQSWGHRERHGPGRLGLLRARGGGRGPPRWGPILRDCTHGPGGDRAITQIPADAWTAIKYPRAIFDQDEGRWVSEAQVAEIAFTAFTSRRHSEHISARLIVRRVKRLNPKSVPAGQGTLFSI
jgi:hypothetical protein